MSGLPLVSAIMIFLDGERFIEEAIESVMAQTYRNWELLLVDDGSTDGSTAIALRYAGAHPDRIMYLEHDGHANRGMSASRNLGIRHARGKYVALLDADDVWLPLKFARQVPIMEAAPGVAMMYGPTEYWYGWTGIPGDAERDRITSLGVALNTRYEPPALSTLVYPLGTAAAPCLCSLLVRTDAIRDVGGFEDAFHGFYEDQAFLAKMYLRHRILVSEGCWDRYRIHPDSCSAVTRETGRYEAFRDAFLNWLTNYLRANGIFLPEVERALRNARSQQRQAAGILLRVADGNEAHLTLPADSPDAVRVDITAAVTTVGYDIQLNLLGYPVLAGDRCSLSCCARADQPRSIGIGFAKGQDPWTTLGAYYQLELTSEWQAFERSFVVTEDESNARIHFDVGDSKVSVDLSSVVLRSLASGREIKRTVGTPSAVQPDAAIPGSGAVDDQARVIAPPAA